MLAGERGDLIEIEPVGVSSHAVTNEVVENTTDIELHTVREVAAVRQVEPQHGVAWL